MPYRLRQGDSGRILEGVFQEDGVTISVSSATLLELVTVSPSGDTTSYPATFPAGGDGSDGRVRYVQLAEDFPDAGRWVGYWRAVMPNPPEIDADRCSLPIAILVDPVPGRGAI